MTYIEIDEEQAKKFTGGIFFEDTSGQPYVFKDGFVAIIRPSKHFVDPDPVPAE